jgi:hypothetical protein
MGYLQELQRELSQLLGNMDTAQQKEIVGWVGKKVLESYRKGRADGQTRTQLARLHCADQAEPRPSTTFRERLAAASYRRVGKEAILPRRPLAGVPEHKKSARPDTV